MNGPKNIFDQLAELAERQTLAEQSSRKEHEEILEALRSSSAQKPQVDPLQKRIEERNREVWFRSFFQNAIREYIWGGSRAEFEQSKDKALSFGYGAICCMLFSTIVSTLLFGCYGFLTLIENIWLLHAFLGMQHVRHAKRIYWDVEYSLNSFEKFEKDADGVYRNTCQIKGGYKWSAILGGISFVVNSLYAIFGGNCRLPWIVVILELACLGLSILAIVKVQDFFLMYGPIRFSGPDMKGQPIAIYHDITGNLYTEDELLKRYPFIYDEDLKNPPLEN